MAFRTFTAIPSQQWVLKALAARQAQEFSSQLVLFFDLDHKALGPMVPWLQPKAVAQEPSNLYVYKTTFILELYKAYDFLLLLGDYVGLLCSSDVESFLRQLQHYAQEEPPVRLAGCAFFGTFVNLWPSGPLGSGAGEHFVQASAGPAFLALPTLASLHFKEKKGLFYIYRLLLKVPQFYSCFFFWLGCGPFLALSLSFSRTPSSALRR